MQTLGVDKRVTQTYISGHLRALCRRGREKERVSGPTRRLAKCYRFCRSRQPTSKLVRIAGLRARYFVRATRMFLPGRFYRRSHHRETRENFCVVIYRRGFPQMPASAPEGFYAVLSRADSVTLRRDGTFSILPGRGIMLRRRASIVKHFVRYFACQLRNEVR